jgi:hypothetical protein
VSALDLAPMLIWRPRENAVALEATTAGVVRDIKIGRLMRMAQRLQKDGEATVTVGAYVGQYAPRGGALALVTADASTWRRARIRRAFTIDTRARRSRLYDVISQLHQEALQAIREVQPSTYDDVMELWVELLLALPQAWQRYGNAFDESTVGEFGRFGLGPADAAAKNLYIEAREATKAMHDLAAEAFMLPDRIATRSLDYDAPALLLRMLALYVELYPTVAELEDSRLRERVGCQNSVRARRTLRFAGRTLILAPLTPLWQYFSRRPKSDHDHIGEVDRSRIVGPLSSEDGALGRNFRRNQHGAQAEDRQATWIVTRWAATPVTAVPSVRRRASGRDVRARPAQFVAHCGAPLATIRGRVTKTTAVRTQRLHRIARFERLRTVVRIWR